MASIPRRSEGREGEIPTQLGGAVRAGVYYLAKIGQETLTLGEKTKVKKAEKRQRVKKAEKRQTKSEKSREKAESKEKGKKQKDLQKCQREHSSGSGPGGPRSLEAAMAGRGRHGHGSVVLCAWGVYYLAKIGPETPRSCH
ncbi:hypothetical protein NDU88_008216 [Pleurodeles waltl]|uniref:Uncharacterized protein n=1 Tax=Pleurodeles waltl TaxID=8319 RepID=A0AAV7RV42_PLEWA|nr:hypothetical protein NDU88_008216 [Pleurodeles waltl]